MAYQAINLHQKIELFTETWQSKAVAEPRGVVNTSSAGGGRTTSNDVWV